MHSIKRRVGLITTNCLILLVVIHIVIADDTQDDGTAEGDGTNEDGTVEDRTDEYSDEDSEDDDGPLCPKDDSPVHKPCDENGECNIDGYYCANIPWKGEEKQYCCLENPASGSGTDSDEDDPNCQDKSKDFCEKHANWCIYPVCGTSDYADDMRDNCTKTCNRCTNCKDLGADCPAIFCNRMAYPRYEYLMNWQCPRTCERDCDNRPYYYGDSGNGGKRSGRVGTLRPGTGGVGINWNEYEVNR